jgi:hypothetical protein
MSKLLSLVNPFAVFGGKSASVSRGATQIKLVPAKSRSVALSSRTQRSVLGGQVSVFQKGLAMSLVGLNAIMLVSYVVAINTSAASGYEITKLQRSVHELTEQSKKLTLQNAEINSMSTIHQSLDQEGFVPVAGAEYIQLLSHQLTQR